MRLASLLLILAASVSHAQSPTPAPKKAMLLDAGFGPAPMEIKAPPPRPTPTPTPTPRPAAIAKATPVVTPAAKPAARKQGASVSDHTRQMFFKALDQRQFFRAASCGEFADLIFQNVGLPPIGQTDPVNGTRGKFDRAAEKQDRPTFSDSVTSATNPALTSRVTAASVEADRWQLEVLRSRPAKTPPKPLAGVKPTPTPRPVDDSVEEAAKQPLMTKSQFVFRTVVRGAKLTCELIAFRFGVGAGASAVNAGGESSLKMRDVPIDECATDYLLNPVLPADHAANEMKDGFGWLRYDCITALHYSAEAKTRALEK